MKININNLAAEINKSLEEYKNLQTEQLKKAVRKAGSAVKNQIQNTAPKDTGEYAKSWRVTKTGETSNRLNLVVNSKDRYQLTHLLEYGHAKRGGGRVAAKPHLEAAEQTGIEVLESEISKWTK